MHRQSRAGSDSKLLVGPPRPARRKWINIGMALFLATQIGVPLTYYLYKEPTDERFAWRMFSSVHMSDWSRLRIVETVHRDGQSRQQIVPVKELLVDSSWQGLYSAQPDMRDKFLHEYLTASGADRLDYEAQGIWPSGEKMKPVRAVLRRGDGAVRLSAE